MGIFKKKKEPKLQMGFATISPNGKPDVEIHGAGFDNGDGLEAMVDIQGSIRCVATLSDGIVTEVIKVMSTEGVIEAAACIEVIMEAMAKANPEAYALAMQYNRGAKVMTMKLDDKTGESIVELLRQAMKETMEESGEADA